MAPETVVFPVEEVRMILELARKAVRVPECGPQGWSKSEQDPAALLAAFPCLRLKPGMVLRAYRFREGCNGSGIVWAMPAASPFPEPEECVPLRDRFLEPPRPPGALEVMEAIEGDGSPWSYLCASLFAREVGEFGALWHGCWWSTHVILGADPFTSPEQFGGKDVFDRPSGVPEEWEWQEPKPEEWRPRVTMDAGRVVVAFYTYSGLGMQSLYRHLDRYARGSYLPRREIKAVATGPMGFVF